MKQKTWQLNLYILKQDSNEATVIELSHWNLCASNVVKVTCSTTVYIVISKFRLIISKLRDTLAWQEWATVNSSTGKLERNLKNWHIVDIEYYRYMA